MQVCAHACQRSLSFTSRRFGISVEAYQIKTNECKNGSDTADLFSRATPFRPIALSPKGKSEKTRKERERKKTLLSQVWRKQYRTHGFVLHSEE
ncbi:hypothetical protein NPIL_21371 [Nephila pilipes]|uniref:Uncharacterized protein n=1 Tax=Nephila pilipes TaxID=299642 RepID=A0A8X6U6X3_NEPPI|nr:hypothetical protein NPIL_21371 [Nephila pilipes]